MAEVKDYGNVVRYSPPPVEKLWIYRLTPATRKVADAAVNALDHIAAEHMREQLREALRGLEFDGSAAAWGEDAVRRGRDGEKLSAGDWNALADCVRARAEAEGRETVTA